MCLGDVRRGHRHPGDSDCIRGREDVVQDILIPEHRLPALPDIIGHQSSSWDIILGHDHPRPSPHTSLHPRTSPKDINLHPRHRRRTSSPPSREHHPSDVIISIRGRHLKAPAIRTTRIDKLDKMFDDNMMIIPFRRIRSSDKIRYRAVCTDPV